LSALSNGFEGAPGYNEASSQGWAASATANASYNVLFKAPSGKKSEAQIEAFEDTWHSSDLISDFFNSIDPELT
jgi:hypothetical protein